MMRLLLGGLLGLALLAPAHAAGLADYAGTWEGAMLYEDPASISDAFDDGQRYRIVIDSSAVQMLEARDGTFQDTHINHMEVEADHVKLTWVNEGEDAVVISKGWCLMLRDPDTLIARQVFANEYGGSKCHESIRLGGVFKRVKP